MFSFETKQTPKIRVHMAEDLAFAVLSELRPDRTASLFRRELLGWFCQIFNIRLKQSQLTFKTASLRPDSSCHFHSANHRHSIHRIQTYEQPKLILSDLIGFSRGV
jgi:hypothetical protein